MPLFLCCNVIAQSDADALLLTATLLLTTEWMCRILLGEFVFYSNFTLHLFPWSGY